VRVLMFNQYLVTNDSAGTTRPYEIARRLVERGDKVTVITGDSVYFTGRKFEGSGWFWHRETIEGIQVVRVRIPFGGHRGYVQRIIGFLWFMPFAFFAALGRGPADVVIASSTPLTIGMPAWLISRLRGAPFVLELRDLWPDHAVVWDIVKNRWLIRATYWLEAFLYKRAKSIITLTDGIRQEVIAKGIPAQKVRTITNASNLSIFTPNGPVADLTHVGIPQGSFVCLYSGSLGMGNYLDFILDVAEELREEPKVHFLFLGTGLEKQHLKDEVRNRKLDQVHFLEPVLKRDVPSHLRAATVGFAFVKPSSLTYICLPNKFFEYLACGVVPIVNYTGEASNYLESARAGIAVSPSDKHEVAQVIRDLAGSPEKLQELCTNARQLAERRFGWNHKAVEFREVLALAAAKDSQRRADEIGEPEVEARV